MRQSSIISQRFLLSLAYLLAACSTPPPVERPAVQQSPTTSRYYRSDPWVLVDTRRDRLSVMRGDQPIEVFYNIAIGNAGAGRKYRRGDNITPTGTFRIGWVNWHSRFKTFFGLDYPNQDYVERAYSAGLISKPDYDSIRYALASGATPPQDTPMGGSIGIHGVGQGDPFIHATQNWTSGCVALNNEQIDRLSRWVHVGTTVEIH